MNLQVLGVISNSSNSPDEHIQAWKRQPDRIASEPHGLSFAHYKSVLKDKYLVHMDMGLRSIPLEVDFIPDDWKTIIDVEILKKAGVLNVDKMRLIQLMRSDFQINKDVGLRRRHNSS
jgi:hypothetical protein